MSFGAALCSAARFLLPNTAIHKHTLNFAVLYIPRKYLQFPRQGRLSQACVHLSPCCMAPWYCYVSFSSTTAVYRVVSNRKTINMYVCTCTYNVIPSKFWFPSRVSCCRAFGRTTKPGSDSVAKNQSNELIQHAFFDTAGSFDGSPLPHLCLTYITYPKLFSSFLLPW